MKLRTASSLPLKCLAVSVHHTRGLQFPGDCRLFYVTITKYLRQTARRKNIFFFWLSVLEVSVHDILEVSVQAIDL